MKLEPFSPEKIELRKKFPPTYGRKKSRSLSESQQRSMQEYFPQYSVMPEPESLAKLQEEMKGRNVHLEIGFGDGEHLVHQAVQNPKSIIIGCEIYLNSFVVALQKAQREKLTNIRFYNNDTRYLLEHFPHDSLDVVYILFPDPWPKKKQFKRRIVNKQTLEMLYPLLKANGRIRLATDIDSYFEQMLEVFARDKRYKLITEEKDFAVVPADHIETRYHQKAHREGRTPRFLEYIKV